MKTIFFLLGLLSAGIAFGQTGFENLFVDCHVQGSTTIFDYRNKKWIFTDSIDARKPTWPASTFKIINLLIALETGVIKDEQEVVKWVGKIDTVKYGYRPDTYHDMTVKKAFELSAGWVYIELSKRIGKERYKNWLAKSKYGNLDLSKPDADFWNFGNLAISPQNQVELLIGLYENKLPFSQRNMDILKQVMVTEHTEQYTIRSKTGWGRDPVSDIGWWVGYVETPSNVYFFATRLIKKQTDKNPGFMKCRKTITKAILKQIKAIE